MSFEERGVEKTGRIQRTLDDEIARILFGAGVEQAIDDELPWMTEVDRAHVVMLAEAGLVPEATAARLLGEIASLARDRFAPLRGRPAPRGLYLLYERHLIDRLGHDVGGVLQTGRSRNDLSATVLRMRMRAPLTGLASRVAALVTTLAGRAERSMHIVMPVHTHYQAALPVSFGHYCAGVAAALGRDLDAVVASARDLDASPLGAGAAGGTSFPIRPARTATLLGFSEVIASSLDAVASRDVVLRVLGAAAILGVTLSRLANDLLLWTTAEFGFLHLPDQLVGSSSMMPQKRNPFLLEHVLGRSAAPLGAFTAACTAMHGTPFSNSIAVGTEGVRPFWASLRDVTEATILATAVVFGMSPDEAAMEERARRGHVSATRLAEWLVARRGMSFRDAHHAVGELVTRAIADGAPLARAAATAFDAKELETELEPRAACAAARYGGGPGGDGPRDATAEALRATARFETWRATREQRWRDARETLDGEVRRRTAPTRGDPEP